MESNEQATEVNSQALETGPSLGFSKLRIKTTKAVVKATTNPSTHKPGAEMEINTQYDTQLPLEPDDIEEEKVKPALSPQSKPWARLITKGEDPITYELANIAQDAEGKYNLVQLGRGPTCNIRFTNSPRISNKHCTLFCKMNQVDRNNPYLEAWIEDLSANGTFLNRSLKLKKNVPRLLRTGDEIYMVNPDLVRLGGSGVAESDILMNSFTIILNLPNPTQGVISESLRSHTMSKKPTKELGRSSTVIRLLNQQRNIRDHYEFRELLGSGAAGQVYRGIQKDTGRDWAVKIIDTRHMSVSDPAAVTKEAEMLRSIRHPNVIHLEDIFSEGNLIYLVMELSAGGDLFERIVKKKRYPENEAKDVMRQLIEAMAFLHERKVAHRDLKPENILLPYRDNDTFIKIIDFGLAKVIDEKEGGAKTYCGTPQYFAPEVMERKNTVSAEGRYNVEADMWSCGCIFYVLLVGSFPFHAKNDRMLFAAIRGAKYSTSGPIWATISPEAKHLLSQLLTVDPKLRITAAQAVQHEWFTGGPTTVSSATNTLYPMLSDEQLMPPPAAAPHHGGNNNHSNPHGTAMEVSTTPEVSQAAGDDSNGKVAGGKRKRSQAGNDSVGNNEATGTTARKKSGAKKSKSVAAAADASSI